MIKSLLSVKSVTSLLAIGVALSVLTTGAVAQTVKYKLLNIEENQPNRAKYITKH